MDTFTVLYQETFRWLDNQLPPANRPVTAPVALRVLSSRGSGCGGGGAASVSSISASDGAARTVSPRRTSVHELLKPLVDRGSQVFVAQNPLKLRVGVELDSKLAKFEGAPGGLLAAGSLLRVLERITLPDGVERAAVARVGEYEGACGWITVARDDSLSPVPRARRAPTRGFKRSSSAAAAAAAVAPAAAPSASSEVAADASGVANSSDPAASAGGLAGAPSMAPAKSAGKKRRKDGEVSDGRPALTSSVQLMEAAEELLRQAAIEEAKLDDAKKPLKVRRRERDEEAYQFHAAPIPYPSPKRPLLRSAPPPPLAPTTRMLMLQVRLGEVLVRTNAKIGEVVTSWAKRGTEPVTKMQFRTNVRKLIEENIAGLKINVKEIDMLFDAFDDVCAAPWAPQADIEMSTHPPFPCLLRSSPSSPYAAFTSIHSRPSLRTTAAL